MSGYPIVLHGAVIDAVVVGGGRVAERKARALLATGARVRVLAPEISQPLRELGLSAPGCTLIERAFAKGDLSGATLVVAATDDRDVNASVAVEARRCGVLVNVADDGGAGDFITPAIHRRGDLLVAVSASGVPAAAARIRDALAARFDDRYAEAIGQLTALRTRMLESGDRAGWRSAMNELVGDDFCDSVDSGAFAEERIRWGS